MAPLIVLKFGGTSLADTSRIEAVSLLIKQEIEAGNRVLVVVSAMAGVTNQLVGFVRALTPYFDPREYDAIVASGEQITAGLLAIALQKNGVAARSWQAWQAGIMSDDLPMKAHIKGVQSLQLRDDIAKGRVPVVTGFQAVTHEGRVVTLGRGGSDTSAVMCAAYLKAERCDIYTDVDGVYVVDPRLIPGAPKHDFIAYEDMLELASVGAKVLQVRSVAEAMSREVKLRVLSTFEDQPGTMIVHQDEVLQKKPFSGIVMSQDEVFVRIKSSCFCMKILQSISQLAISIDMVSLHGDHLTFLVEDIQAEQLKYELERKANIFQLERIDFRKDVAKVSVIGQGLRSHQGFLDMFFQALDRSTKEVLSFMATEMRASAVVPLADGGDLVKSLYAQLDLKSS